jgi:hypothetical protein
LARELLPYVNICKHVMISRGSRDRGGSPPRPTLGAGARLSRRARGIGRTREMRGRRWDDFDRIMAKRR